MKHTMLVTLAMLACITAVSCATLAAQPQVEPDAAVAEAPQTKPVEPQIIETSVWLSVPQDVEKSEPTGGSWLSENGKIRWVPVGKLRYHKASGVLLAPAVNEPKPDDK